MLLFFIFRQKNITAPKSLLRGVILSLADSSPIINTRGTKLRGSAARGTVNFLFRTPILSCNTQPRTFDSSIHTTTTFVGHSSESPAICSTSSFASSAHISSPNNLRNPPTKSMAQRWNVPLEASPEDMAALLQPAAKLLAENEVVAFPTETVYGLGGNALSDDAAKKIFQAKGRPADNPLIVHIADESMIPMVAARMTPTAKLLTKHFWPGPLTVLVPAGPKISRLCTAGKICKG